MQRVDALPTVNLPLEHAEHEDAPPLGPCTPVDMVCKGHMSQGYPESNRLSKDGTEAHSR